jgi:peptidoglycan/LPS O-acetylase OafA/YrhL
MATISGDPAQTPHTRSAALNPHRAAAGTRLTGLDALRGVAALLVVLFHFTTRYQEKFGHVSPPSFELPWGHLGVNLFFLISGFVIFMTLERTSAPLGFLVSRFSRLYPAYWVAALGAYLIYRAVPELGLPVSPGQALANGLMFHNLLGVPHVDGVFWTLEVELLFYWAMFLIWLAVGFQAPQRWIAAWLALSIAVAAGEHLGIHAPYIATRVLILSCFPYFALGILLYLRYMRRSFRWHVEGALGVAALVAIALIDGPWRVLWTLVGLCAFVLVTFRWSDSAPVRLLAGVGAMSYPLYLVHETAGWALIHHLESRGVQPDLAIVAAIVAALVCAYALHRLVEQPAMERIRQAWSRRRQGATVANGQRQWAWIVGTLLVGAAILVGNRLHQHL